MGKRKQTLEESMSEILADAVRAGVVSQSEADCWMALLRQPENRDKDLVDLPENLWPAAQRVYLWRTPRRGATLH